ncbi:ABC transporter ATP-binding protein [Halocynthiibacter styelae]|uniref:ABC transporter ATP-binding protein n=1 Tax=Halocynthiibacter styelae TaxID=2761955 RepID=A0A8J7LPD3_9RHOB|nr:ABC transporter ATP-binding protein [Paenihalocynthiibacter styelae]MBI1492662.1 ABC transporter ATP-binding protein [Paenihalocynthiibacter styelae]
MNILETKGLTKTYGGLNANYNIDFTLPRGEIHALIGPNGAGKSTFVGMLSGRIPATRGKVWFDGAEVTRLPAHKRISLGIAYTFQITSVFGKLPVRENVALAVRRILGRDREAVRAKVDGVMERVGLTEQADQLAGDLSYGHQRVLEIAMGLAQNPELFILDEPTQGLALPEVEAFMQLVKDLRGETTILLIEHNMNVVMEVSDSLTVLNNGEVLARGTPEEIRANADVQAAYLGGA